MTKTSSTESSASTNNGTLTEEQKRLLRAIIELDTKSIPFEEQEIFATTSEDLAKSPDDPQAALKHFLVHAFMRGRLDKVSISFAKKALESLNVWFAGSNWDTLLAEKEPKAAMQGRKVIGLQNSTDCPTADSLMKALEKAGVNNGADRLVVATALWRIGQLPERHVYKAAKAAVATGGAELATFYKKLEGPYVKDKILTFYLREVAAKERPWQPGDWKSRASDAQYLFPVDTWIATLGSALGITTESPGNLHTEVRLPLLAALQKLDLDPLAFDFKAWFLGAHSLKVAIDLLKKQKGTLATIG